MIDRSVAHDLRGLIAAASSNIEFVRGHAIGEELALALVESGHELRIASDVVALLAAHGERPLEVDVRAAVLVHRGAHATAVDATDPPFLLRGSANELATFAQQLCEMAPRGRVRIEGDTCTVAPIEKHASIAGCSVEAALSDEGLLLRQTSKY